MPLVVTLVAVVAIASITLYASSSDVPEGSPAEPPRPAETVVSTPTEKPVLPGGGREIFPQRRFVSLYGHPSAPALGVLGEQGIQASIDRVRALVAQYQPFSAEQIIPSLEIIATIASSEPGPDGDYSNEAKVDELEEWVKESQKQGIYVVLDFQSGRSDFLSQMKKYEKLFAYPNVGSALDPEWRLHGSQKPLKQIGSASAAEVNAAGAWLADLVRQRDLPQKIFILHQFMISMLPERSHTQMFPELATIVHADGQGPRAQKFDTWKALKEDLPAQIRLGWKNFYREDPEILSPKETMTVVEPHPWFISYQ